MAKSLHHFPAAMLLIGIISLLCLHMADAQTGVCLGTIANNLPPAPEIIDLCNRYGIQRMRLFNPNPSVLQALRGSPIEITVGVPNDIIPEIAGNLSAATSWVQFNILRYANNVNFKYIAVGNEISPSDSSSARLAPFVALAMLNIYDAITAAGLRNRIKVSTVLSAAVLAQSYPPSAGAFRKDIRPFFLDPIIEFLVNKLSPLLLNVYPYFSYISDTKDISLDYALFTSPSPVVFDGQYQYQNLFDAIVDATYAALEKAGGANVKIVVSETGWPSFGGTATSIENARIYNNNLIQHVKGGTPKRPGKPIETYIFDLFDENEKSPELEKHWGLFYPNKQPKYPFIFPKGCKPKGKGRKSCH